MTSIKNCIQQIEGRYNPENDSLGSGQVTWVDAHLLEIAKDLQEQIDVLNEAAIPDKSKQRIDSLERQVKQLRATINEATGIIEGLLEKKIPAETAARKWLVEWYS
jgi:hypothetical protein